MKHKDGVQPEKEYYDLIKSKIHMYLGLSDYDEGQLPTEEVDFLLDSMKLSILYDMDSVEKLFHNDKEYSDTQYERRLIKKLNPRSREKIYLEALTDVLSETILQLHHVGDDMVYALNEKCETALTTKESRKLHAKVALGLAKEDQQTQEEPGFAKYHTRSEASALSNAGLLSRRKQVTWSSHNEVHFIEKKPKLK